MGQFRIKIYISPVAGGDAPPKSAKRSTFSHKMDQKKKGVFDVQKSTFLSKRYTFLGFCKKKKKKRTWLRAWSTLVPWLLVLALLECWLYQNKNKIWICICKLQQLTMNPLTPYVALSVHKASALSCVRTWLDIVSFTQITVIWFINFNKKLIYA